MGCGLVLSAVEIQNRLYLLSARKRRGVVEMEKTGTA